MDDPHTRYSKRLVSNLAKMLPLRNTLVVYNTSKIHLLPSVYLWSRILLVIMKPLCAVFEWNDRLLLCNWLQAEAPLFWL